jgi:hypothetical protein
MHKDISPDQLVDEEPYLSHDRFEKTEMIMCHQAEAGGEAE